MIGSAVQGGQIAAHTFRMTTQVLKTSLFISCTMSFLYLLYKSIQIPLFYWKAEYYHYLSSYFHQSKIAVEGSFWNELTNHTVRTMKIEIPAQQLYSYTQAYSLVFENYAFESLFKAFWIFLIVGFLSYLVFIVVGRKSKGRKLISGKTLISPWKLSLRLKLSGKASDLKIGSLNLLKGSETKHILVTGSTGSGKSNCFFHLLNQIRARKERLVIIDTTGVFVEKYYRAGKDILLNPFDPRSAKWSPWIECREKSDYEYIAKSLIPDTHHHSDTFWQTSAQTLLSAILEKTSLMKNNSDITKWMMCTDLKMLSEYLVGTPASSIINTDSEKTAGSIRAVASSYLKGFQYLEDTQQPFSIRQWVETENNDSWLFLATTPLKRAVSNPLLSTWYTIASISLRSLPIDLKRRLWFVIDELPSLPRLFELEVFLSEARKYGGCSLISLQTLSQLESIYGKEVASTIIANCMTRIVFNEGDMKVAKEISTIFGEIEFNEYNQSLSYGANDIRDGVNLALNNKIRPIVSPSELASLKPNEAFVKLPGNYPISQVKLKISR